MNDERGHEHERTLRGLAFIGGGIAAAIVVSLVATLLREMVWSELHRGNYRNLEELIDRLKLISWGRVGAFACTSVLVIFGCVMLASAAVPRIRALALTAAIGHGLQVAGTVAVTLLTDRRDVDEDIYRLVYHLSDACNLVAFVTLGLALVGAVQHRGGTVSPLAWAIAIGGLLFDVVTMVIDLVEPNWLYATDARRWLVYGTFLAVMASRAALVFGARRALQRTTAMTTSTDPGRGDGTYEGRRALEGEGWTSAADGLGLYRGGLIAKLVITCVTLAIVGYALMSRNPSGMRGLMLILPIAEVIAAIVMLFGLVRYASNLPPQVGASGSAIGGVICFVLGGLMQVYALSIVWRLHSFQQKAERATSMWDMPSIGDLMDKAETLPWIELLATVTGLIGLLLVLSSLKVLARWIGERGLEGTAHGLAIGMALLTVFAGAARWYMATARRPSLGLVLVLGLVALIWGLAMIIQYIALLRELKQVMEAGQPQIPTARVTSAPPPPSE